VLRAKDTTTRKRITPGIGNRSSGIGQQATDRGTWDLELPLWLAAGLLLAAALGGCSRRDVLTARLREMPDDYARRVVADAVWAGGSVYTWAERRTLRLDLVRTDHLPGAQAASDEVWLVDLAGGRVRIEKPAARQVITYDGAAWRAFVAGKASADLELRAAAAGDVALARALAPLPFSLLEPGLRIEYVGTRTGPGEARTWDRLLVTYAGGGYQPGDRTVLEFDRETHRLDAAFISWAEAPFLGGMLRVEMDEWRTVAGLALAHRWRLTPVDEAGRPTGPVRYTFRVRSARFDVPAGWGAFSRP